MTDTKETSDLLPCPFCGDKASTRHIRDGREVWCRGCGAAGSPKFHGPLNIPPAEDRAIAAWNRRAPTPEAATLIKAEESLAPFDEMAGEMFARNWNDDGVAISFITQNGPLRLTFKEFRAVRATMTEIKKLRGE